MKETTHLTWESFAQVEIRIGTIVSAEQFEKARKPALLLHIDFGEKLGIKKTSAQITDFYQPENLPGKQVAAVVNFPPKQIANIMSECLVLGAVGENGEVTLLQTERPAPNGLRVS